MRRIVLVVVVLVVALYSANISAFTIVDEENNQPISLATESTDNETVYLLSWQGNKLRTSLGVFLTNGIQMTDESGLTKDQIPLQSKPPIVEFIKENSRIIEIKILPNP